MFIIVNRSFCVTFHFSFASFLLPTIIHCLLFSVRLVNIYFAMLYLAIKWYNQWLNLKWGFVGLWSLLSLWAVSPVVLNPMKKKLKMKILQYSSTRKCFPMLTCVKFRITAWKNAN